MKKFYEEYGDLSILPTPLAKLPWSFNCLLIDKVKPMDKRIWYANKCLENGWSYVVTEHQIELAEYYSVAPQIVQRINAEPDAKEKWNALYESLVLPCVFMIKGGKYEEAYRLYKKTTLALKEQYAV